MSDNEGRRARAINWLRAHRRTSALAAGITLVVIAGGFTGATAYSTAAAQEAALGQATSAHIRAQSESVALSVDAAVLSFETSQALSYQQNLSSDVLGQDSYLGAGTTTALQPLSDALQAAISKIAADGSSPASVHLRPALAGAIDVPSVSRSWSTQQLGVRARTLRSTASKAHSLRSEIARLRAELKVSLNDIDAELAELAEGLPAAEQSLIAASPLAGDAEKAALNQALSSVQASSATPGQLAGYIAAAKNVQTSQATAAAAKAAAEAAAKATAAKAAAAQPDGPSDPHCSAPVPGVKHIYVSVAQQHMWACTGPVLALESAVTTGASALTNVNNATPTGTFRINGKSRNVHLVGSDANGSWDDAVAYWISYIGRSYGFHDASWQTFPFGSSLYTTQGSHGCVHLPLDTIAQIYNWAPIGTQVTIS